MAQDRSTATVCSSAETEDWLSMELAEENSLRKAIIAWSQAHARPLLAGASLAIWTMVLMAVVFG